MSHRKHFHCEISSHQRPIHTFEDLGMRLQEDAQGEEEAALSARDACMFINSKGIFFGGGDGHRLPDEVVDRSRLLKDMKESGVEGHVKLCLNVAQVQRWLNFTTCITDDVPALVMVLQVCEVDLADKPCGTDHAHFSPIRTSYAHLPCFRLPCIQLRCVHKLAARQHPRVDTIGHASKLRLPHCGTMPAAG
jgi:hypothetical protein